MDAVTTVERSEIERPSLPARARIGVIIPSVNSMTEPQFNRFAPPGLGVHVARARVAGAWKRPLVDMAEEIATSARLLSDVAPDLIVFHCTDTSMTQGPHGEVRILDIVQEAAGIEAVATSRLVLEALQALGLRKTCGGHGPDPMEGRQHTQCRQTYGGARALGAQSSAESQHTTNDERGVVMDGCHDTYYAWRIILVIVTDSQAPMRRECLLRAGTPTPWCTAA